MLTQNRSARLNILSIMFVFIIVAVPMAIAFAAEAPESTNKVPKPALDSNVVGVAVLTGRVINHADEPLENARVRIAIPATDMRFVDSETNHKLLETKSDSNGDYRLDIPGIDKPTTISVDASKAGYRKLAGTLMSGGDVRNIEVTPGVVTNVSCSLIPSLYLKGLVVDEDGNPIPTVEISANAQYARSVGGVERTVSNQDGSFELFNYSFEPFSHADDVAKGVISFSHPNFIGNEIEDIYSLSLGQQKHLSIVLSAGHKVSGTLLNAAGQPALNVMIKAVGENGTNRKAAMTDSNGNFSLHGLVPGPTVLHAHALDLKQKVKLSVDLNSDKNNLEVRLESIALPSQPATTTVLGMQLADTTAELKTVYDLYFEKGALILDAGENSNRLEIGQLAEGYNFWMVGNKRVGSVLEFVDQIIAEASSQETNEYSVRVVYNFKRKESEGSNTQYLKLTKDNLEQLRKVSVQLNSH